MLNKKGFTLVEIIVVLVIVSILTAVAIPTYNDYMEQGMAQAAKNNLIIIGNAEQSYYFNNGNFYKTVMDGGPASGFLPALDTALSLNITDNNYTYQCQLGPSGPSNQPGFLCIANRNGTQLEYYEYISEMPGMTSHITCGSPTPSYCPSS